MRKEVTHQQGEVGRLRRGVTYLKGKHAPLRRGSRWLLRNTQRGFRVILWIGIGQFSRAGNALLPYYQRYVPLGVKKMIPYRLRQAIARRLFHEAASQLDGSRAAANRIDTHFHTRHLAAISHSVMRSPTVDRALVNKRLTVAVISWDVCHNAVGRAHMIAEALSRYFNVVLLGPAFRHFGGRVWEPLESAVLPVVALPGGDLPELVRAYERIAGRLQADAIISCKPRLPSLLLGHLLKRELNRPLFVDIDDYELAFTGSGTPLEIQDVIDAPEDERRAPHSDTWTCFCDNYLDGTDGFFVSNGTLEHRYGGVVVPHARDERLFDPALYDRPALRRELGLAADDKVVLFAGTPHVHKGILTTLAAVVAIPDARVKMLVVGKPPNRTLEQKLRQMGGNRLILLGNRPIIELPCYLACSDIVCLLQDPSSEIARWQLPAKIAEALAFGLPVLATRVPPLETLIKAGVVTETSHRTLRDDLEQHLLTRARNAERDRSLRRAYFLKHMTYAAIGRSMAAAIHARLQRKDFSPPNPITPMITDLAARLTPGPHETVRPAASSRGLDIVMVWKQHDLCLYGRRIDMLVKYLAARAEVRRVITLEPPISYEELRQWQHNHVAHQARSLYVEWLRKSWGLHDSEKVRRHNFTYSAGAQKAPLSAWHWPGGDQYQDSLADFFDRNDVDPAKAVFIVYPQNEHISYIVGRFRPSLVIADVVDDQRAWSTVDRGTRRLLTEHYREVLGLSDFVITNCEPLKQAMSEFHDDIRVLPNGIDTYVDESYPLSARFREFNGLPHPRIGFVGNLEEKIDIALLRSMAAKRPQWQVVLVGSVHANPKVLELADLPNIHFAGVVPYEEAKHWIRNFDVAIIPHLRTELTRHMNPLKFYVYIGLGVPVVSTPVDNLGELSQHVAIADNVDAFIAAVERALNRQKRAINPDLSRDIRNNTWEQRVDTLLSWLNAENVGKGSVR